MSDKSKDTSIYALSNWKFVVALLGKILKIIGAILACILLLLLIFFVVAFISRSLGSSGLWDWGKVYAEEFIPKIPLLNTFWTGSLQLANIAENPETLITNQRIASRMEEIRVSDKKMNVAISKYSLDNLNNLYDEKEPIEATATLVAENTFDDPMNINIKCQLKDVKDAVVVDLPEIETSDKPEGIITIEPNEKKVTTIGCDVKDGITGLQKDILAVPIRLIVSYDYLASSFVKIYTLTKEKQKEMRLANIDPFQDIKDIDLIKREEGAYIVRPVSSKNTPEKVAIEIGSSQPLNENEGYKLKVALTADTLGWEGHMRELKDIYLLVPAGITMSSEECDFQDSGESYEDFDVINLRKFVLKPELLKKANLRCDKVKDIFSDECKDLLITGLTYDCKFKLDQASEQISHDYTLWAEALYNYEDTHSKIATIQKTTTL